MSHRVAYGMLNHVYTGRSVNNATRLTGEGKAFPVSPPIVPPVAVDRLTGPQPIVQQQPSQQPLQQQAPGSFGSLLTLSQVGASKHNRRQPHASLVYCSLCPAV